MPFVQENVIMQNWRRSGLCTGLGAYYFGSKPFEGVNFKTNKISVSLCTARTLALQ